MGFYSGGLIDSRGATPAAFLSRTLFVDSVAGSDTAELLRGTESLPYATLTAAIAASRSGDTLYLKRGSQFREHPGTFTKRLSIRSYGAGERPILDFSLPLTGTWEAAAGYANVWKLSVSYLSIFGTEFTEEGNAVWQVFDGPPTYDAAGLPTGQLTLSNGRFFASVQWVNEDRTHAEHLAYTRDNPGTLYVANSADTDKATLPILEGADEFTFYIHLADSSDPNDADLSISSPQTRGFYMVGGGEASDLWLTRTGFAHVSKFEGVQCHNLRFDGYHRHGSFFNSCVVRDCESYGVYLSGACYHGYRETSIVGTDDGVKYLRCKAINGAWGFYSHNDSGVLPAQKFQRVFDCYVENVQHPSQASVEETHTIKGMTAKNVVYAPLANAVEDSVVTIPSFADLAEGSGVFLSPSGEFKNCYFGGGEGRLLLNNGAGDLTFEDCTVLLDGGNTNYTGDITLTNSVWMGETTRITAATNSYIDQMALDESGDSASVAGVTGCFSKRRAFSLDIAAEADGYTTITAVDSTTIELTSGSNIVTVTRSGGGNLNDFPGANRTYRFYDSADEFELIAFADSISGQFTPTVTLTLDRNSPSSKSYTWTSVPTAIQWRTMTLAAIESSVDSLYAHAHSTGNIVTMYGDTADLAQVVVGTYLRIYYAPASRPDIDAGIYYVSAKSGSLVTLTQVAVHPDTPSNLAEWLQDAGHVFPDTESSLGVTLARATRLEARFAWGVLATGATLAGPNGEDATLTERNILGPDSAWAFKVENGRPGDGVRITVSGKPETLVSDEWTLAGTLYLYDLAPAWTVGSGGIRRLVNDHYLRASEVGCNL